MLRPMIHVRFRRVPCSSRSPISSLPIYRSSIKTAFSSDEGRLPFFGRSSMPRALHVQSSRGRSRFGTKEAPSDRYNYTKPASPLSTAEWPEPTYSKLVSGYQSRQESRREQESGWWEKFIGHGSSYPIDLDRHFVICTNVLGSCYGSTGPHSINPLTGNRYGTEFPIVSIFDMVRAQFKLLNYLGIERLYASVGSSMGGMQSIVAAWLEPERVGKVVSISGCGRSGPSSIAIRYAQRSDHNDNAGWFHQSTSLDGRSELEQRLLLRLSSSPCGHEIGSSIATITYRSGPEWEQRFGRRRRSVHAHNSLSPPTLSPDFLIETYLDHQGEQFCLKYDANSLLYVSKAMDLFDMTVEGLNELERYRTEAPSSDEPSFSGQPEPHTFKRFQSTQEFLILGVQTDILFPITLQRELAEAIRTSSSDLPLIKLQRHLF
ncbi:hypothetical protein KEM48_003832 [Puccinia striiformis f. sp. tritici PST-130]|nr:hypothetical protein KEM48_003832 [Puccinia striiformis f. sp. tritici PST-130]